MNKLSMKPPNHRVPCPWMMHPRRKEETMVVYSLRGYIDERDGQIATRCAMWYVVIPEGIAQAYGYRHGIMSNLTIWHDVFPLNHMA